jgi:large subunit ribosomal protein L23
MNLSEERLFKIIKAPVISEKSTRVADQYRQYVFEVSLEATKPEIKKAVEKMFNVNVTSVQVSRVNGKTRVFRQKEGCRQTWKKAYVTLKEGQEIRFGGTE